MPIVILKVRSEELMQTIFNKRPVRLLGAFAGSVQPADGCAICRFSSIRGLRNRAQFANCQDPATPPNTSMSAKQSHIMFILSRGEMVKLEVGVLCTRQCGDRVQ